MKSQINLYLHCQACDEFLDSFDILNEDEFKGLCEECYSEAMEAAYEDQDIL